MNKKDMCEMYEEMQAENYGYRKGIEDEKKKRVEQTENNISKDIDLPIPQKDDEYKQCWICSKDKVEEKTKLGWTHNSYIIPKEFIEMLLQGYSLILFDGDYTSEIKMEDNYEQKI